MPRVMPRCAHLHEYIPDERGNQLCTRQSYKTASACISPFREGRRSLRFKGGYTINLSTVELPTRVMNAKF